MAAHSDWRDASIYLAAVGRLPDHFASARFEMRPIRQRDAPRSFIVSGRGERVPPRSKSFEKRDERISNELKLTGR